MSDIESVAHTEGSSAFIAVPAPTSKGIPVITITTAGNSSAKTEKPKPLPPLPSHRYRYSLWHDLRSNDITGDQLRNPRVRKGPPIKEKVFYDVKDEEGTSIHHSKKGSKRKEMQRESENWENALRVNLSYQDLAHDYQVESLHRILKRLTSAEEIQLMDDNLQDLRSFNFPHCITLNISQNYISSFRKLPKCAVLQTLNLSDNSISSFDGINYLRKYPMLHWLDLQRNPICFEPAYRQRIFAALPQLMVLDCISRLPSDDEEFSVEREGCVVS